ncbi:MAG: sigma factor-like helix-turn-helix DNA-binding protein [Candidatus Dormibacteria bacterium]
MINVEAPVQPSASELARLVRENLDELLTYATHLVGDPDDALEFVAGGVYHASRYPPSRLAVDGRAALYRAVTRACRQEQRFPPRPTGPARFFKRNRRSLNADVQGGAAGRINTVKRALSLVSQDRRAALLLRDLGGLDYREMAQALECSPEAAARLLAAARREFGTVYREIAI